MTQLCVIPGCRVRGRHLDGCDDGECAGCLPRIAHEGNTCDVCLGRATDRLAEIAALAPDAETIALGMARRGSGGSRGKPGSRAPGNDDARDILDAVTNAITTLERDIAETRGLHRGVAAVARLGVPDPLATACRGLSGQLGWVRHAIDDQGQPWAVHVYAEIGDCAGRMRSLVNGPSEQKYLGPCGAEQGVTPDEDCDGDVYAYRGAQHGRCRTCGTEVSTSEREAWLDGQVRNEAFSAKWISEAHGVRENTIRVWAHRGRLRSYWRTATGLVAAWTDLPLDPELTGDQRAAREAEIAAELKARGPRLHYVGDVLDLAAADAARRAEAQAKRARRAATETERMSA